MSINKFSQKFELRNLFRNIYFWLTIGALILLFYVGFITFFLPKTTSEITEVKTNELSNGSIMKDVEVKNDSVGGLSKKATKNESAPGKSAKLKDVKFHFMTAGGWIDADEQRMTIVIKVLNLNANMIKTVINADGVEIKIDDVEAKIVNIEPYKKNQLLARAFAPLEVKKFDKFIAGDSQQVKVTVVLHYADKSADDEFIKTFSKTDKTDVEGIRIKWNK